MIATLRYRCLVQTALCLTIGVVLAGCSAPITRIDSTLPKQLQDRQIIVTLTEDRESELPGVIQSIYDDYGLPPKGKFPLGSIGVQCAVFEVPEDWSITEALERLRKDRRVDAAQTNQSFQSQQSAHNDPYASMQYSVAAMGAVDVHRWSTGKGVKIAVIDTGVDTEHPDLVGRIVRTENFVDGGEVSFTHDRHGTSIAGIIAARADNGIGIFGIAPDAEIIATKACWYKNTTTLSASCSSWTLAKAVDFAITQGARIINMSLTGPTDPLLARLLQQAYMRGIVTVAATAEPEAKESGFPASLDAVVPVMASNVQNTIAHTQWRQTGVLAAPGVEILTTAPPANYDFASGSSVATAHISGALALVLQLVPSTSAADLIAILRANTRPLTYADGQIATDIKRVNVCEMLQAKADYVDCAMAKTALE